MFSSICLICEEVLKNEEVISTKCGHVFHRECIEPWLNSNQTCPTCRQVTSNTNLIKLYFSFDDHKANLQLDEILKANEELTASIKDLRIKSLKFEDDLREAQTKLREATVNSTRLERQKQLDDMTIAGITGIKNESTKEIIKLNHQIQTLKLDLLAEKQLRRIHQKSLHELNPGDKTYDPKSIELDENTPDLTNFGESSTSSSFQVPEFNKITVVAPKPKELKPYVIPSKMLKANENPLRPSTMSSFPRRIPPNKDPKPIGFVFQSPNNQSDPMQIQFTSGHSAPSGEPSTENSLAPTQLSMTTFKNQKRSFGELFVFPDTSPASTASPSTSSNSFVNYFASIFPGTSSATSNPSTFTSANNTMRNYRDAQQSPPSPGPGGPKVSNR